MAEIFVHTGKEEHIYAPRSDTTRMKLIKWLSKIVIGTVLITSITMFTTWYVVNMYVRIYFDNISSWLWVKRFNLSNLLSRLAGELNIVKRETGEAAAPSKAVQRRKPSS